MTLIHHITHFSNLPGILAERGLVCDADTEREGLCEQSIAYGNIKDRRRRRLVETLAGDPVAEGGVLADYVPFYFTNRSPMLGAIHKGLVAGYESGQREIVYLVSSVETVAESDCVWCFTDGHAVEAPTEFFERIEDLPRVDWDAVATWRWGGRWLTADPDVGRRKQAEFLVHGHFPWEMVERIGVHDEEMRRTVNAMLADAEHKPRVTLEPNWYFN